MLRTRPVYSVRSRLARDSVLKRAAARVAYGGVRMATGMIVLSGQSLEHDKARLPLSWIRLVEYPLEYYTCIGTNSSY